jgi:hypothetical protein
VLKITKDSANPESPRVSLCGRFTGEYIPEVEKALSGSGKVALDLRNVMFVDRAAMEFLCGARSRDIDIENIPSYVMRWIEQEGCNSPKNPEPFKK